MTGFSLSWRARALRTLIPDVAVSLRLPDGLRLQISSRKHLGLIRSKTRFREFEIARRLADLVEANAVIYDIGANVGLYTIGFAANGQRIVHSFEPSILALSYLRRNVETNALVNVVVHPVLLSDSSGTRNFLLDDLTTAQSRVSESLEGGVAMTCADLDSYAQARSMPSPALVKIDVEGHDLAVLHGMKSVLRTYPIVYVEGGIRSADGRLLSLSFLSGLGYSIWNLNRTHRLQADTQEYAWLAVR